MKKYGNYQIFKLLVLLSAISLLAGCGGGGGGGGGGVTPKTITFIMPKTYYASDGKEYPIPAGKEVKFYTLSDVETGIFSADHFFDGKTGSIKIQCPLPDSLIGKERYIFAVIELEGTFDPQGKSQQETMDAVTEGKILFGRALGDEGEQKLYTLTPGVIIGNFEFFGKAAGDPIDPTHMINFIMPDTYRDPGGNNYPIPEGKEVNFYASLEAGGEIIDFDYVFTGTTGGNVECDLPSSLIGEERYFYAVVVLEGDFDLEGKTQQETMDAVTEGKILFGRALGDEGEQKLYTLTPGVEIGNFVFWGKGEGAPTEPTHKIKFIMPDTYIDQGSNEYSFPEGEEVKFYALTDTNEPLVADYVFTGTTGGNIECDLPSHLVNEEYFFFAVVVLEGDFDLEGKSQQDIGAAVAEGKILFGRALEDPPSQNPKSYTLTPGVEIGNFVFWGKGEGE